MSLVEERETMSQPSTEDRSYRTAVIITAVIGFLFVALGVGIGYGLGAEKGTDEPTADERAIASMQSNFDRGKVCPPYRDLLDSGVYGMDDLVAMGVEAWNSTRSVPLTPPVQAELERLIRSCA